MGAKYEIIINEVEIIKRIKYKNINSLRNQKWFKYLDIFIRSVRRLLDNYTTSQLERTKYITLKLTNLLDLQLKLTHFIPITFTLLGCIAKIWDWMEGIS